MNRKFIGVSQKEKLIDEVKLLKKKLEHKVKNY